MSRDVPFEPDKICDVCGKPGAWDFMGDYICPGCYEKPASPNSDAAHNAGIDEAISVVAYWLKGLGTEAAIIDNLIALKRPSSAVGEE